MLNDHLSSTQLLAVRDGRSVERELLVHLVSCPECQAAFDDTRWTLVLRRAREAVVEGEHLTDDELTAYVERALPEDRLISIRSHLRGCDRCTAFYGRQRAINRRDGYRSPTPQAVAETMARFRPNPIRRLGVLLLRRLGQGVELVFRPKTMSWTDGLVAGAGTRGISETPHPSRPSARFRRLKSESSRRTQRRYARDPDEFAGLSDEAAAFDLRFQEREAEAGPAGTAVVDAGPWRLVLTGGRAAEGTFVGISIVDGESGTPAAGIPVRLTSGMWTVAKLTTGDDGHAKLSPVPDGAEIIVGDDPRFRLSVRDLD